MVLESEVVTADQSSPNPVSGECSAHKSNNTSFRNSIEETSSVVQMITSKATKSMKNMFDQNQTTSIQKCIQVSTPD